MFLAAPCYSKETSYNRIIDEFIDENLMQQIKSIDKQRIIIKTSYSKIVQMWKTQTTPNLRSRFNINPQPSLRSYPNAKEQKNIVKLCQLSFAESEPKQLWMTNKQSQDQKADKQKSSLKNQPVRLDKLYESGQFESRQQSSVQQGSSAVLNRNVSKQAMMVMELQQNQQLRIDLFRAQKTISDLQNMCQNMQTKIVQIIESKKNQMQSRLSKTVSKHKNKQIDQSTKKRVKNNKQNQEIKICEFKQDQQEIDKKQKQIAEIWKNCYNDLIDYITNYTADIAFLVEQYKQLQAKTTHYKNCSKKLKKTEQSTLKLLKESNQKLQKSQALSLKLLEDLKQRDSKIQEYHIESKNLKMKIIEHLEQIQRLRRQNKLQVRDGISFKQVSKSLQQELIQQRSKKRQLQNQIKNKDKLLQISKNNQKMQEDRLVLMQQQLQEMKKFNENLMSEYKQLSNKIQLNEQKINEKYQASQKMYEQRISQYERQISITKKQKQQTETKINQKNQQLNEQLQKLQIIKNTLQKQLSERACIIVQQEQQLNKMKDKISNTQLELESRIHQKDRQIQYLQQLRSIANQKNQQLKMELDQVRADMMVIIQQLKVRELEVEKYKSISQSHQKNYKKKYQHQQQNLINQQAMNKQTKKLNMNPTLGKIINVSNENNKNLKNEKNEGLIWKKISKNDEQTFQQQSDENLQCDNQGQEKWARNSKQDRQDIDQIQEVFKQLTVVENKKNSIKISHIQIQGLDDNQQSMETPKMWRNSLGSGSSFSFQNDMNKTSKPQLFSPLNKTINMEGNKMNRSSKKNEYEGHTKIQAKSKQKFNLQSFQNKIILKENAKLLLSFNRLSFK